MSTALRTYILTINGGSSSVKFALFESARLSKTFYGKIDRIGMDGTTLSYTHAETSVQKQFPVSGKDIETVLHEVVQKYLPEGILIAVGYRVVHGGEHYFAPTRITDHVLDTLKTLTPLAPRHLPGEISLITTLREMFPHIPHIACFDTGFHHTLPSLAQLLPLPIRYRTQGVRRYGFHGLSCEYLMKQLRDTYGEPIDTQKIILAHLGGGSSLTAVRNGQVIETTMGFTPNSGVPMGTRSGDIDAGVLEYLIMNAHLTPTDAFHLLNHESGVHAISGTTADMEVLLREAVTDIHAKDAVDYFCYHIQKSIGALTAALQGVDLIVFSGGMGEKSAPIRDHISRTLTHLGISIDDTRNATNSGRISSNDSRVILYAIPTDEESVIAQHTYGCL